MWKPWKISEGRAFPYKIPKDPVPIISKAAVATEMVSDGRFIPLLIIDTATRPDIANLIEVHQKMPPGDAVTAWGRLLDGPSGHMALFIHFQRPIETGMVLNFDPVQHGDVVDLALRARAIYLQPGKPGDRLYHNLETARMIVDIGGQLPKGLWDKCWTKALIKNFRSEGLPKHLAKSRADSVVSAFRRMINNMNDWEPGIYIELGDD